MALFIPSFGYITVIPTVCQFGAVSRSDRNIKLRSSAIRLKSIDKTVNIPLPRCKSAFCGALQLNIADF